MENKTTENSLQDLSKILASNESLKDYIFRREGGIDFQAVSEGVDQKRSIKTGFKYLEDELRRIYELQNKNPSTSIEDKDLVKKLRDRMYIYSSKKNEYYKEFLLSDSNLSLLSKPENGQKSIDTYTVIQDLGNEKANEFFSAYLVKHQSQIRNNKEMLDFLDVNNLLDGFSERNKIGLKNNKHSVTIELQTQGPMNNEQFFKFIEDNSSMRNKSDAYYYNIEQKGWKSFKNSEAMQLAYLRNDIMKVNEQGLKQSLISNKQKEEFDSLFEVSSFKEISQEQPPKRNNRLKNNM